METASVAGPGAWTLNKRWAATSLKSTLMKGPAVPAGASTKLADRLPHTPQSSQVTLNVEFELLSPLKAC